MKFVQRTATDVMFMVNRCFFEADHGRASLALQRLREWDEAFPGNAHILYAEGVIRREHLGQGVLAASAFGQAYHTSMGRDEKETRWFSLCNAIELAKDEEEFRGWAARAFDERGCDTPECKMFKTVLDRLDRAIPYHTVALELAEQNTKRGENGASASRNEVILRSGVLAPEAELGARVKRALGLRALDEAARAKRTAMREWFPKDECLALLAAIAELERATELDPYDAALWNYLSAWHSRLENHDETIRYADRAIELRPNLYHRPHINKAFALWHLGRQPEALSCAKEALHQAETGEESAAEVDNARSVVQMCSAPGQQPDDLDVLRPVIEGILESALRASEEEFGQMRHGLPLENVVNQLLGHLSKVQSNPYVGYIPLMADLLADFTPESAYRVSVIVSQRTTEVIEYCLCACLHIIAHSTGTLRRDASRYFLLMTLHFPDGAAIRAYYRQAVLAPSMAASDAMKDLNRILTAELAKLNPYLPELVTQQSPLDAAECAQATRDILVPLSGSHQYSSQPQPRGCAVGLVGVMGAVALVSLLAYLLRTIF